MGTHRTRSAVTTLLALAACLCLAGNVAMATPVISIDTMEEWETALGGGGSGGGAYIVPVLADEFRDMILNEPEWPTYYDDAKFFTPELYVMNHTDSHGKEEPALVMYWGDEARAASGQEPLVEGDRLAAAWDLVYTEDPAFGVSNWIEFSIHAPAWCMYVSLNLLDAAGNYREWIWHVGDPTNPGEEGQIPFCTWTTVRVNPVTLESNYVYETVFTHGLGFDLNSIQFIRFNENGVWSQEFRDPATGLVWNAWDHVTVQPEPSTMLLVAGGLLALARKRRKKK